MAMTGELTLMGKASFDGAMALLSVQISFALTVHETSYVAVGRGVWMSTFMLSVSVSAFSLTISTNFYEP